MVLMGQLKYKYAATLTLPDGTQSTCVVDEFTPPDKKSEAVIRQSQKYGQLVLRGPVSYGEGMMRLALRVSTDGSVVENAALINGLYAVGDSDSDTIDISLMLNNLLSGQVDAEVSYQQDYSYCKVTSLKMDPVNRKQDDDFVYLEVSFIPSKVSKLYGDQLGTTASS
jgi:hypothetical protein